MRVPRRDYRKRGALRTKLLLLVLGAVGVVCVAASSASARSAASQVPRIGTGSPQTGPFSPSDEGVAGEDEFAGEGQESDEGPDPYSGTISFSTGAGGGASVNSAKKAKSNPTFDAGFEGLNHYQQRYAAATSSRSSRPTSGCAPATATWSRSSTTS